MRLHTCGEKADREAGVEGGGLAGTQEVQGGGENLGGGVDCLASL